jgi:hypothetical protein
LYDPLHARATSDKEVGMENLQGESVRAPSSQSDDRMSTPADRLAPEREVVPEVTLDAAPGAVHATHAPALDPADGPEVRTSLPEARYVDGTGWLVGG